MEDAEYAQILDDYLRSVLDAFQTKAKDYYGGSQTLEDKFNRSRAIKEALRLMGNRDTFGIAASDYNNCPSGQICCGGVCREAPCPEAALKELENRFKPHA